MWNRFSHIQKTGVGLAFLLLIASPLAQVHAATILDAPTGTSGTPGAFDFSNSTIPSDSTSFTGLPAGTTITPVSQITTNAALDATPADTAATASTDTETKSSSGGSWGGGGGGCNFLSTFNGGSLGDCLLDTVAFFILGFANFMLGVAGVLLNWVIVKTVFQFSTLIGNSEGLLTAWGILRDIGNLLLLFGFVLMGIGTILNTGKLPDKKAIPKLIIFAVLLNFSLFASEAVIDISNVLTSVMYSQANTDPCNNISDQDCAINHGIAGHIMEATGLSGIYDIKSLDPSMFANKLWVILGLALFATIGTVVLLAAAFMLAWRSIILTGLIIVSPLGFAGMALKPLEKITGKWWKTLIHQSFFAPILFLLLFISLKVTEGFTANSANNNSLATALLNPGASTMGIIMVFFLISGALIASLMAAKSYGAMGADMAIKTAGGIAFGSGAMIARNTVGRGSAAASRAIRSSGLGSTVFGRTLAGVTDAGAKASYDPRAKLPKVFGKYTQLDLGKPDKTQSGGYVAIEKKKTDALVAYSKSLKMSGTEEERKKVLDADKTGAKTNLETKNKDIDKKDKDLKETKKTKKGAWKEREANLKKQITDLEEKTENNEDGKETNRLEQQIAAEKLNAQRLLSKGETQNAFASNAKIATLEKERDELGNAQKKLAELRDIQLRELTQYNTEIKDLDADIENGQRQKKTALETYENTISTIDAELDSINPQKRYAEALERNQLGGQQNSEAAKRIKAEFKKTGRDKALEALKGAFESKDPEALDGAIEALKNTGDNSEGDGDKK